ncbi:hypothetical protein CALVIDRAFT_530812 [Calocera viscosa TUFC12733]|uniref:Protein kinase domain-containing protein n=1 Tax=Calocera viscosa (strain TUFC12733) TaxID=1330018 RepID=A0A167HAB9_CALVF|nr:hypothetical protein CALVIDRAFT_530812 [Calocera viscosa TUFC12733]
MTALIVNNFKMQSGSSFMLCHGDILTFPSKQSFKVQCSRMPSIRPEALKGLSVDAEGSGVAVVGRGRYLIQSLELGSCVILELALGGDLFSYLAQRDTIDTKEARYCLLQIGYAIRYLHQFGIVHGDIKPEVSWLPPFKTWPEIE